MQERYVDLSQVRLHVVEEGEGPLVVLLHGFPEFWYSWRHQIPALAAAGMRVVAPDMRGYNLSDKPKGVSSYSIEHLTGDVRELIEACGAERACVVGHDWGGAVAWQFAMRHPGSLERLAILNAAHPLVLGRALRTARQLRKSWYMFLFQIPLLPEAIGRIGSYASLRKTLKSDPVRPDAVTDEDIDKYVEAMSQPGAATAAINYYRAAMRSLLRPREESAVRAIEAPVLVIWGEQDKYLGRELAEPPRALVPHARLERIGDASHFVQYDRPERVNELLIPFLRGDA
jgi:pimeloyl-ACP methyl ester carboxylesterase